MYEIGIMLMIADFVWATLTSLLHTSYIIANRLTKTLTLVNPICYAAHGAVESCLEFTNILAPAAAPALAFDHALRHDRPGDMV